MPSISLTYTALGPTIADVRVAPSQPRQQALKDVGAEVPQPTSGVFLVDTGAYITVIDRTLLAPLGLESTGTALSHTPSTAGAPVPFDEYDVMLIIPNLSSDSPAWIIPAMPAFESDLISQGIHGLIGLEIGQYFLDDDDWLLATGDWIAQWQIQSEPPRQPRIGIG